MKCNNNISTGLCQSIWKSLPETNLWRPVPLFESCWPEFRVSHWTSPVKTIIVNNFSGSSYLLTSTLELQPVSRRDLETRTRWEEREGRRTRTSRKQRFSDKGRGEAEESSPNISLWHAFHSSVWSDQHHSSQPQFISDMKILNLWLSKKFQITRYEIELTSRTAALFYPQKNNRDPGLFSLIT